MDTDIFLISIIALFIGHSFGDHWIQTHHQAITKGSPGWQGRRACLTHVITLTLTKLVILAITYYGTGLWPDPMWFCIGILVDGSSHYWADRRTTLERLAKMVRKTEFYQLGTDLGEHIGTGKYAMDQAFHHVFLWVGAVLISL